ncbi:uncharacterized protein MKK02DRAFT_45759 [Dioszegia hungarica]|uniref:ABM domain-containing protein n=1 Tax=Dioszegia hungarica TaxID=4972 RepID=A0AA38LWR5_9TREE|nr:uncharacterized protein MKK02DRAFT_45759 [Dioszegia hungarica]KAI9637049.1 hypothetical protein MKK02DRAFT_45759 [Dioszegia hungarica]
MSFILVATMLAAEGKTEEIIKALLVPKSRPCNCADPSAILPIVEDSRQERGCLQYQFSQAQDDPRRIMIWEEYESDEAFEEHKRGKNFMAFAARLDELIEGELSLKRFNVLDRFH